MTTFNISVDIALGDLQAEILSQVQPVISQALEMTMEHGYNLWLSLVKTGKLPPFERDVYLASIKREMTSPLSAHIWTDWDRAEQIEAGIPARDMKTMLQTSAKTRVSKKGQKYLIIPFRHGAAGANTLSKAMPPAVYQQAKRLSTSSIVGKTTRIGGTGKVVPQAKYQWGGRLPKGLDTFHNKDHYAGMVRMNTSAGGAKSSSYLTFRVMSESSKGWIYPARAAKHWGQHLQDVLTPLLEKSIAEALRE